MLFVESKLTVFVLGSGGGPLADIPAIWPEIRSVVFSESLEPHGLFTTIKQAQQVVKQFRVEYNTPRPR